MFKMTGTILRNLSLRKATRRYPFEVRDPFADSRGEIVNEIERCIFCGTCEVKCPSRCIAVDRATAVWTYDPFACVYCGVCVDTCPGKSLLQNPHYRKPATDRIIVRLQGVLKKRAKEKRTDTDPPATLEG